MSATGKPSDAGTTLVEALVVVAITAAAAMVAFPQMQRSLLILAQHLTVSTVAASLRQARAEAIRRDQVIAFTVDPRGTDYGVWPSGVSHAAPGVTVTTAGDETRSIAFYGDGSSTGGAVVVRGGSRPRVVTVQPTGGAVAVAP